jgi:hypothetical protein
VDWRRGSPLTRILGMLAPLLCIGARLALSLPWMRRWWRGGMRSCAPTTTSGPRRFCAEDQGGRGWGSAALIKRTQAPGNWQQRSASDYWARRVVQRPGLRRDHGRIAPARPVPLRLPHLEWHGKGRAEPPRPQSWSTETAASANRCRGRLLGFSAHRRHPNPRRGALTLSRTSPHCTGAI